MSNPDDKSTGSPPPARKPPQSRKAKSGGGPPPKGKPHVVDPIDAARTTQGSAATTAVIPGAKDQPPSAKPRATNTQPSRTSSPAAQPGRRASLRLVHVEPWSVTRLAFVVSVAMMIVAVVAVSIFWLVLSVTGVWGQINDSVTSVLSDDGGTFDIKDYLGFGRMFGLTLVLSAINVVLMTALATIGAHLYNLAAQLLGGLEVTFSDD